jgi:hypothetical protein
MGDGVSDKHSLGENISIALVDFRERFSFVKKPLGDFYTVLKWHKVNVGSPSS